VPICVSVTSDGTTTPEELNARHVKGVKTTLFAERRPETEHGGTNVRSSPGNAAGLTKRGGFAYTAKQVVVYAKKGSPIGSYVPLRLKLVENN
jgi:hypothetical protein